MKTTKTKATSTTSETAFAPLSPAAKDRVLAEVKWMIENGQLRPEALDPTIGIRS